MGFFVRPAAEKDIPQMVRLWREMMDFHAEVDPRFRPLPSPEGEEVWARYVRESVLNDDDWCVFVAEEGGRLIGQIMGVLREPYPVFEPGRYGYLTDVAVDAAARRRGVGRALFASAKEWLRERGADHVELRAAHRNAISQSFWREMGCTDYMAILWCNLEA
jgi:ribosomal protein S18 acetylase RimI-like enzyme